MNESEFNQRVDELLAQIEDAIEDCGVDIDYDSAGGILTLDFENSSKIIINRQTAVRQLWVATRGGGFHFDYSPDHDQWVIENGDIELFDALSRYCTDQAGEPVHLQAG
ncbi:MAG: iron donor protein CyaY [Proteobacteria bacterium]|jgi:CyaY protein|nr:iron donor protein CyaY [Pseudomonadota bacterium]